MCAAALLCCSSAAVLQHWSAAAQKCCSTSLLQHCSTEELQHCSAVAKKCCSAAALKCCSAAAALLCYSGFLILKVSWRLKNEPGVEGYTLRLKRFFILKVPSPFLTPDRLLDSKGSWFWKCLDGWKMKKRTVCDFVSSYKYIGPDQSLICSYSQKGDKLRE